MLDLTFEALVLRSWAMVHLNLQEKLIGMSKLFNIVINAGVTLFENDCYWG